MKLIITCDIPKEYTDDEIIENKDELIKVTKEFLEEQGFENVVGSVTK